MLKLLTGIVCLTIGTSSFAIAKDICDGSKQFDTPVEIGGLASVIGDIGSELGTGDSLASKACAIGYDNWSDEEPVVAFERALLKELGTTYDDPQKNNIISKFFNDNEEKLICEDDSDESIRDNEHIFKRSIARGEHFFIKHVAKSDDYEINLNFFEMIDGKKETILDYLDKILVDQESAAEEYDVDELLLLREYLEENDAKRGNEL
jgi:hypothetical protein